MVREYKSKEWFMIEHARVARLATVGADGAPHTIPICPAVIDGKIVIALEGASRKHRNIVGDARVAVLFDDYVEDWESLRGVLVSGSAVEISDAAEHAHAIEVLNAKFPQYPVLAALEPDDPVILIEPSSVASWGFED